MGLINNGLVFTVNDTTKDFISWLEGSSSEVRVPVGTKKLTNILYGQSGVKTVFIPASVTDISGYFARYSGLTKIKFPILLKNLGRESFRDCENLKIAVFYSMDTSCEYGVFINCPATVCAFEGSTAASMYASNNLHIIGQDSDFVADSGVVTAYTGDAVKVAVPETIDSQAVLQTRGTFSGNTAVSSVVLLGNVYSVGEDTFNGCASLTSFSTYDDIITEYGARAFSGCSSLTSVPFPECLQTIGEEAFKDCTSLVSVSLPVSLENIGNGAFDGCTAITDITVATGFNADGLDLSACAGLSESTVAAMFNALKDRTEEEPRTLKLGDTLLGSISEGTLAVATAKNWNII